MHPHIIILGFLLTGFQCQATKYQKTAFPDGIPQCGADALRYTMVSAPNFISKENSGISFYGLQ